MSLITHCMKKYYNTLDSFYNISSADRKNFRAVCGIKKDR
ncbi:Uncharacterized protein dnm_078800 [Desulfonema magnum]|uniref:Uncharacterized protein n=1 Tax=Desulfonema magnum TaxID=45655 RepID=A0A975BU51_9BACT|nr:Uncharacterized protein dnm_078800 [Desulfonema magnum]